MTRIILLLILILTLIAIFKQPARAAMEPEEIMVRLATGMSLRCTVYDRQGVRCRQIRKARKIHKAA